MVFIYRTLGSDHLWSLTCDHVWSWKFGLKSWKGLNLLVNMHLNPGYIYIYIYIYIEIIYLYIYIIYILLKYIYLSNSLISGKYATTLLLKAPLSVIATIIGHRS